MRTLTLRTAGRWLLVLSLALAGCAALNVEYAELAHACDIATDPNCVGVGTGGPGSGGGPAGGGSGAGGSGGGSSKPDPCAKYPGPLHQLCTSSKGVGCLQIYDEYSTILSLDALNEILKVNECPTLTDAEVPPSPATLAQRAAASFELPDPSGARSPSQAMNFHGYPFTYTGLWTWYWTSQGTWKTLTTTARAGGNYATVTAKPVSLSFDPGDGSASVSCAGPGTPWVDSYGNDNPSTDGGCGYQYTSVTGPGYDHPVTSTQTITWQLTWTGSNNTSGTLTSKSTSTTGQLNVLQIQTVVTR